MQSKELADFAKATLGKERAPEGAVDRLRSAAEALYSVLVMHGNDARRGRELRAVEKALAEFSHVSEPGGDEGGA